MKLTVMCRLIAQRKVDLLKIYLDWSIKEIYWDNNIINSSSMIKISSNNNWLP